MPAPLEEHQIPPTPQAHWLQRVQDELIAMGNWLPSSWHQRQSVQELVVPVLEHETLQPRPKGKKKQKTSSKETAFSLELS